MNLNIQNVNYSSAIPENIQTQFPSSGGNPSQTAAEYAKTAAQTASGEYSKSTITIPTNLSSKEAGIALLQSLAVGDIFSGEITNITANEITLALSDAVNIKAVLSDALSYNIGDTATFSVKENSGEHIVLKSINRENLKNLMNDQTIQGALRQAGLVINETTVSLVHNLMKQGLPIDSGTLNAYVKLLQNAPAATPEDVVFMTKMGMPVTQENAISLHQYYDFSNGLSDHVEELTQKMASFVGEAGNLSPAHAADLIKQIVSSYTPELSVPEPIGIVVPLPEREEMADSIRNLVVPLTLAEPEADGAPAVTMESRPVEELAQKIILGQSSSKEILSDLTQLLDTQVIDKNMLDDFFQGKDFKNLLSNFIRQEMFLDPENLSGENLKRLFAKILVDNENLAARFALNDRSDALLSGIQTTSKEIDFMNQVNQFLSFVQVPIKMSGQNAHGDLYVYNRKKENGSDDDELTAFLHLDMDELGPIDIFVKLYNNNVSTNFKVARDEILTYIQQNMDLLNRALSQKGYLVTSEVSLNSREYDFKKDVLEQEFPPVEIKRFSFDVRA